MVAFRNEISICLLQLEKKQRAWEFDCYRGVGCCNEILRDVNEMAEPTP